MQRQREALLKPSKVRVYHSITIITLDVQTEITKISLPHFHLMKTMMQIRFPDYRMPKMIYHTHIWMLLSLELENITRTLTHPSTRKWRWNSMMKIISMVNKAYPNQVLSTRKRPLARNSRELYSPHLTTLIDSSTIFWLQEKMEEVVPDQPILIKRDQWSFWRVKA